MSNTMTEEEKKVADEAKAEADKKVEEEAKKAKEGIPPEDNEGETAEQKAEREKKEADALLESEHKAELDAERERTKKAQEALAKKRFDESEAKRKRKEVAIAVGEEPEEDDEKPLTRSELDTILAREREEAKKEAQGELIKEKVGKMTSSEIEAEHVMEIHKNRQFPIGMPLDEQIEEAYIIANKKRILGMQSELKRALLSKDTKSKDVADTHRDSPSPLEPKLNTNDLSLLKRSGFEWDGKSNAFKLETKGRTIFKSRDLKKTWTVSKK